MAAYSDINGFPEAGFPVLSDVSDRVCLNTLYWNPLKEAGFILDVVGNNRLAGNLSLAGILSGVTSITMNGALSGVSTISASGTATLTSSAPLSMTDVNANIRMPGLNSSIGSVLERVYKGYFKNLDVANTLTINGDDVALIGDIKRYVSGTSNTLPKYNATGITDSKFTDDGTTPKYNTNTIWHSGNDGSGSGLDADLLHGLNLVDSGNNWGGITQIGNDGVMEVGKYLDFHETDTGINDYDGRLHSTGGVPYWNGQQIWNAGNDGHNSGMDADTVDTYQGSSIMASKRQLVNNENLNDLKEIGSYCNITGNGSGNSNFPTNYGIIDISGDGSNFGGIQRSYDANNGDLSYRMNWGGWQPWRKVWDDKNSNLSTVDWSAKDLTVTTAKIGSLSGYLKGTAGVIGAVTTIPQADITNLVSDLSNKQASDATLTSLAAVAGVQGDLLYASGTDAWTRLGKSSTAKSFLKNSGTSNNPAWELITELDITPMAYATLTVASNATTWDCSTGLNKRVTISANLALTITNLVDGMSGDLVINVSSISTISITTAGFTQKKYGSLASKPVGKYHLCWICEGTNIDFNITDTPYA